MSDLPPWPPAFAARLPAAGPRSGTVRRWIIVEGTIRRVVTEEEFRSALRSCIRVEVVRYADEDVLTNICYR